MVDSSIVVALKQGNIEILKSLTDLNAEIQGASPLIWAITGGNLNSVKYLVENGANLSGSGDFSLIGLASRRGFFKIAEFLLDRIADDIDSILGDDFTRKYVLNSVKHGNVLPIQYVFEKQLICKNFFEESYQELNNFTPLSVAVKLNHINLVKYLVEVIGVDVNVVDENGGKIALDHARNKDLTVILLKFSNNQ